MQMLHLIRGVPGSGKTTLAKKYFSDCVLVEADMYFTVGGLYLYDRTKLCRAHEWCQHMTERLLKDGHSVVVANTFVKDWQLWAYLKMFPDAIIWRATGNFKNVHGVPEHKVRQMRERMDDVEGERFINHN